MRASWATIGRAEEHSIATEQLRPGGGVVLAGPSGVGKSRLAGDILDAAEEAGSTVRRLVATASSATVPLGALAPALPTLDASQTSDRFALLRAVVAELVGGGEPGRLVIGIDDAHHLDDLSATAVHQLASARLASVVATLRTGHAPPDAIQALWKDGLLARIELQPLARAETEELVAQMLSGAVTAPTQAFVWQHTAGNPLFVRELVVSGIESGRLSIVDGVWRWDGAVEVTTRLADLVDHRVGALGDPERTTLQLLAFGEPLGLGLLAELDALDGVATLESRGLVVVARDRDRTEARLAHPLYGDVVRGRTPVAQARSVQAVLADGLERMGARRSRDHLRIATLRLSAGIPTDQAVLVTAADMANGLFEHDLAEQLARWALETAPSLEATITLGVALIGKGRFSEADELLARLDLGALDDADVVRVAENRHVALSGVGDADRAEAMLLAADAHLTGPDWRAFLQAERAALLAVAGRFTDALEQAWLVEDETLPEATRFRALSGLGIAWALTGQGQRAIDASAAAAASAVAARPRLPRAPSWVASAWLIGLLYIGDLDGAERLLNVASAEVPSGFSDAWARLLTYRGSTALLRGQPVSAARWLRESTVLHGDNDPGRRAALSGSLLAEALAVAGDTEGAAAWASRSHDRNLGVERWFEPHLDLADAWVAAARHELSAAVAIAEQAAAKAAAGEASMFEAVALHEAIRFGAPHRATQRLAELAETCDGRWVDAFARHAAALDRDDGHALDDVSERFASFGALLHAAEAAAEASGAHERAGLPARAAAAAARAMALMADCEGARTPALSELAEPVRLSRREREVALLAAEGLSNREIADRLSVSVRTVEGHLYQAFAKLGVTRRDELGRLLGTRG